MTDLDCPLNSGRHPTPIISEPAIPLQSARHAWRTLSIRVRRLRLARGRTSVFDLSRGDFVHPCLSAFRLGELRIAIPFRSRGDPYLSSTPHAHCRGYRPPASQGAVGRLPLFEESYSSSFV